MVTATIGLVAIEIVYLPNTHRPDYPRFDKRRQEQQQHAYAKCRLLKLIGLKGNQSSPTLWTRSLVTESRGRVRTRRPEPPL